MTLDALRFRVRLGEATAEDLFEVYSALDTAWRAIGGSPLTFRGETFEGSGNEHEGNDLQSGEPTKVREVEFFFGSHDGRWTARDKADPGVYGTGRTQLDALLDLYQGMKLWIQSYEGDPDPTPTSAQGAQ